MPHLPNKEFRALICTVREDEEFYEDQTPKKIFWSEYSQSQIAEAQETLDFIKNVIDSLDTPPMEGKVGKPLTDPKMLAKAVLISEAFGFTERNAQGWIALLGPYAGITVKLDDRTIGEAYHRKEVLILLKQVFEKTKSSDGKLCGDGSGLETSRKQNYESDKKAGEYLTSIVDSREVVQAFDMSGEQECKAMHKLLELVHGNSLRLDAGFNDRKLVDRIAEKGMVPFVFPKKSNKLNGSMAWKTMYLSFFLDVIQWLMEYHQRNHSESFHASFKTRYGPITKRRNMSKLMQVLARIIQHNRRRLAYFSRLES